MSTYPSRRPACGYRPAPPSSEIAQEPARDLNVALLVRVRHPRPVLPAARPLDGLRQVDRIFDHARVDQALLVVADAKALHQALLRAAGERGRVAHRVLPEVGR